MTFPRIQRRPTIACLALAAAGLAMASGPAQAQDGYYYPPQDNYAPYPGGYGPEPAYAGPDGYGPRYAPAYTVQGGYADAPYVMDDLTVRAAPRYRSRSSTTGAPIEDVIAQRVVTYRDLDLTTPWGVNELNNRVRRAARSACRELDTFHPISAADSPPCYSDAVASAMYQVRDAVSYAQPRW